MLCENCNNMTATTHIKRTVNGITKEYYLCQNCANKLGFNNFNFFEDDDFFGSLLSNQKLKQINEKVCENCNSTYKDIVKSGRMGCPECYIKFKDEILPSLIKMHKSIEHIGKSPLFKDENLPVDDIVNLEKDLKQAILNEEYEKAAEIRDIIKIKRGEIDG